MEKDWYEHHGCSSRSISHTKAHPRRVIGRIVIPIRRVLRYVRLLMLLADLDEFVRDHRPHGSLTGDATEPTEKGYLLTVACPCGVTFMRWVTPEDAEAELLPEAVLANLN